MPNKIILIAALTEDGFIAKNENDDLSWTQDKQLFKQQTIGSAVIVGSATYAIIGGDLPGRENIIFRRSDNPEKIIESVSTERCFIIGGSITYTIFLPFITHVYLTIHPITFGGGLKLLNGGAKLPELNKIKSIQVPGKTNLYQDQYIVCIND